MGLVAGVLEARGFATVVLSCLREITEKVQPPRWLDLPFPLGFPLGMADNAALQRQVLVKAIQLLVRAGQSPLVDEWDG